MRKGLLIAGLLLVSAALSRPLRAQSILPREGEVHIPVILLEFSDVPLSLEDPAAHFDAMLNREGYDKGGATGSVRDYFLENSRGAFRPVFDLYGPVTLEKKMAFYGKDILQNGRRIDDAAPEKALLEACAQLDEEVDFSVYDADEDGIVDLCIFFFAGYDQAEGGPSDAIWSHHWSIQDASEEADREALFDEVRLGNYFCSSELSGHSGTRPIGIGISCHELAHALGLPDFYDVNGAQDGYAGGLYDFSLMCRGLYNNDGRTPPFLSALERHLLGWMPQIPQIPEGDVLLGPVQEQQAYLIPSQTEGEYFVVEYRSGTGWDSPLPEGLVVYHVDRSEREIGEVPARLLWEDWRSYNSLNNLGTHPCYYVIPSSDPTSLNYASAFNPSTLVFPGTGRHLFYDPLDWEGQYAGTQLTCIELRPDAASFRVLTGGGPNVNGLVRNTQGRPVAEALVSLGGTPVTTDARGFFLLPLAGEGSYDLSAVKNGYLDTRESFSVPQGSRMACLNITLHTPGEAKHLTLEKFDPSKTSGSFAESAAIGAVQYTVDELRDYVGWQIGQVECYPYILSQDECIGDLYITVDFGPARVLNRKVENAVLGEFRPVSVDLSEENLRIPEGIGLYIGYGFEKADGNYPLSVVYPGSRGNSYWSAFSLEKSEWQEMYSSSLGQHLDLMLRAGAGEVPASSLEQMGYTYISPGKGTYRSGELYTPSLQVPEHVRVKEVEWTWDGSVLQTESFRLSRGEHLLVAKIVYEDGRREKLQTRVQVRE